ncbi:MAG: nitroreductase family protein [Lentisphaeria bacterium]|nr:nitroreductase family protein [Lentisphaeria bacterium]
MKKLMVLMVMVYATWMLAAGNRVLPLPQKRGGMSLREALDKRHTVRSFQKKELTAQQLADMLWSANGINRENGKRTAPSALDKREVLIYAALPDGVYLYDPELHLSKQILPKISSADVRKYCGKYDAPCYLILVPDKNRQPREIFAAVDTGYVSQNIYLAAQINGLGTCAMGSIVDREKLIRELNTGKNVPLLVHPVGIPR